jgi:peptidoglycan/LPS O-acetylase OafA/YrhL
VKADRSRPGHRGRRRVSPLRRLLPVLGWVAGAAVVLVIALLATGRSLPAALGLALAGAGIVALVVGGLEVTGALRTPAPPDADGATGRDDTGP